MAQRYYCPECGDFSSDREQQMTEEGVLNTPVCKSCGSDCTSLSADPRMKKLNALANRLGVARIEYQSSIDDLKNLAIEVKKDWGLMKLP